MPTKKRCQRYKTCNHVFHNWPMWQYLIGATSHSYVHILTLFYYLQHIYLTVTSFPFLLLNSCFLYRLSKHRFWSEKRSVLHQILSWNTCSPFESSNRLLITTILPFYLLALARKYFFTTINPVLLDQELSSAFQVCLLTLYY